MRERRDVHLDDLELAVQVRVAEITVRADAGVVHERRDAVVDAAQPCGEMLALESPGEIDGERIAGDSVPIPERPRERFERVPTSRDENEVVTVASEQVREVTPDPAGRSGDDGDRARLTAARGCEDRKSVV